MKFKLPLTLFCLILISCEKGDIEIFDSKPIFSSSLNGKWVLVNYWADWCPPCIKEIPEIVSFAEKYPEVKVFAFNFDRLDAEDLRPQIKKFGITYPSMITHPKTLWGIETPKTTYKNHRKTDQNSRPTCKNLIQYCKQTCKYL